MITPYHAKCLANESVNRLSLQCAAAGNVNYAWLLNVVHQRLSEVSSDIDY